MKPLWEFRKAHFRVPVEVLVFSVMVSLLAFSAASSSELSFQFPPEIKFPQTSLIDILGLSLPIRVPESLLLPARIFGLEIDFPEVLLYNLHETILLER